MATTTNYGWTTPDDTALVKDGAAAIRTLGSSVDTTTKALNPSTTLGDIEYRSSTANTNTRLGIGTTGQVLAVSGGVPAWITPVSTAGLVYVGGTTFSGVTSVNVNDVFSANYANYIIQGNFTCASTLGMLLRLRVGGADNTTTNYDRQAISVDGTSVSAERAVDATRWEFAIASARGSFFELKLNNPFATEHTRGFLTAEQYNPNIQLYNSALNFEDTTSFTGFSINFTSTTANLAGTFRVYGLANS
jgi:hypothetical protein